MVRVGVCVDMRGVVHHLLARSHTNTLPFAVNVASSLWPVSFFRILSMRSVDAKRTNPYNSNVLLAVHQSFYQVLIRCSITCTVPSLLFTRSSFFLGFAREFSFKFLAAMK